MRARGFTLLETLVTLVVVAIITSLVAEGLFQIARIERSLQSEGAQPRLEALHTQWVVTTLKGLIVPDPTQDPAFRGTPTEISGQSTLAPVMQANGPTAFRLSLESTDGRSTLWLDVAAHGAEPASRAPLGTWPWADVRWVYQDQRGVAHAQWPPENPPADQPVEQELPSLIRLETREGQRLLLAAAPANNYLPWIHRPGSEVAP